MYSNVGARQPVSRRELSTSQLSKDETSRPTREDVQEFPKRQWTEFVQRLSPAILVMPIPRQTMSRGELFGTVVPEYSTEIGGSSSSVEEETRTRDDAKDQFDEQPKFDAASGRGRRRLSRSWTIDTVSTDGLAGTSGQRGSVVGDDEPDAISTTTATTSESGGGAGGEGYREDRSTTIAIRNAADVSTTTTSTTAAAYGGGHATARTDGCSADESDDAPTTATSSAVGKRWKAESCVSSKWTIFRRWWTTTAASGFWKRGNEGDYSKRITTIENRQLARRTRSHHQIGPE